MGVGRRDCGRERDGRERLLGEFLKGYMRKKLGRGGGWAGYSQDGDFRGLAQACDKVKCFRSADQRC